jgi:DGQHR domain-containing protein
MFKDSTTHGEFYIGVIPYQDLIDITFTDRRKLAGEKDYENYLGIQRPLDLKRVKQITQFIETEDSFFPTAIIIAIPGECASFNDDESILTLKGYKDDVKNISFNEIARVLDGQHRIEGLKNSNILKTFEINVSIFIDMDIADQAYLFSTVNLAQTKVNKSLVYDLFDLAKSRSPQKVLHNCAVALDKHKDSPFYQRIKRLGVSTEGRFNESITQATFVEALMKYISKNPVEDRNIYLKGKKPELVQDIEKGDLIFRNLFIQGKDLELVDIIWNYFESISRKWNKAWNDFSPGTILNKTNGFKALIRFLKPVYLSLSTIGEVPTTKDFDKIISKINLKDEFFNVDEFKPGSSGESRLYSTLLKESGIEKI